MLNAPSGKLHLSNYFKPSLKAKMSAANPRYFHLTIENFHPSADDTQRTQFTVRGNTVDEVLDNIIWNTQPSFGRNEEMFNKLAHLHLSTTDSMLKRNELVRGQPMPAGVEFIYLRFRPLRNTLAAPSS